MRFELLTPPGVGGVAVVAVRGVDRREVATQWLLRPGGAPFELVPGRPLRATLAPGGVAIDDVLVVDRPDLDLLELHVHGSPAVLTVLQEHGRLVVGAVGTDLPGCPPQVTELLVRATTRAQLDLALEQAGTESLDSWLEGALAVESHDERASALRALERRSRIAWAVAQACPAFLVGRQNAGKSTLFNRLVLADRALTGGLPGLTRDPVGEEVELEGYPYRLVDTAGHGSAHDALDRAAIDRGTRAARDGLRILVVDGSIGFGSIERDLVARCDLVVWTRRDRVGRPRDWPQDLPLGPGFDLRDTSVAVAVRRQVGAALRMHRGLPAAPSAGVGGVVAWDEAALEGARGKLLPGSTTG